MASCFSRALEDVTAESRPLLAASWWRTLAQNSCHCRARRTGCGCYNGARCLGNRMGRRPRLEGTQLPLLLTLMRPHEGADARHLRHRGQAVLHVDELLPDVGLHEGPSPDSFEFQKEFAVFNCMHFARVEEDEAVRPPFLQATLLLQEVFGLRGPVVAPPTADGLAAGPQREHGQAFDALLPLGGPAAVLRHGAACEIHLLKHRSLLGQLILNPPCNDSLEGGEDRRGWVDHDDLQHGIIPRFL
mmetsp:Transcript_129176/g.288737  ORF Transcript_129176/g.288737 Transcript_129176/m.288737 type:complete len:245 (-) Transcript_129176:930-1664(-)